MSSEVMAALVASIIALVSAGIGYYLSSRQFEKEFRVKSKSLLAEKKLEIYFNYMRSVNQSWAQFKINGNVNGDVRQKGIDSFEALRLLAPATVEEKAILVNKYFAKLFPGYEITEEEQQAFNEAFYNLKAVAQKEFIVQ
jgi:uncharacterized protein YneF (UPF0154 family)